MSLVAMVHEVFADGGVLSRADVHFQPREGQTQMAVTLAVDARVDAAVNGAEDDVAAAHADAAVAGVAANSADPDHRVTNALVAQYRRDRRDDSGLVAAVHDEAGVIGREMGTVHGRHGSILPDPSTP